MGIAEDDYEITTEVEVTKVTKRQMIDLTEEAGNEAALEMKSKGKKRKRAHTDDGEKRMRRFRAQMPKNYASEESVYYRARTQRMFALDRVRGGTEDCPEETVKLAGSTGNVYTVTVAKVPTCDCPGAVKKAGKGDLCKHVLYVLINVLKAPDHLQYQLAFISSELKEIFALAPPILSPESSNDTHDGRRKPIEDDCPICCLEFEQSKEDEVVYCKASCGNNIHEECFEKWAASKAGGTVTCPFCRSPWQGDEKLLKDLAVDEGASRNEEGYVNVASQLGISGERDYSTYHSFWVRKQARGGNLQAMEATGWV